MKATLTFNLPYDAYDYDCANNGIKYRRVIQDLLSHLRTKTKHPDSAMPDAALEAYERTSAILFDLLDEYGVRDMPE